MIECPRCGSITFEIFGSPKGRVWVIRCGGCHKEIAVVLVLEYEDK